MDMGHSLRSNRFVILILSFQALVLLTTMTLVCVNGWGIFQIERRFDPIWYIDSKSYPILFNDKLNEYFPTFGTRAGIYIGTYQMCAQ